MMTHAEALDALIGDPHLWRIRALCEDDADPERRDAWRARVVRLARGEPDPARPAPAIAVDYGATPRPGGCCP